MAKLIVIRGPSGSGKSTVAIQFQKVLPNPSLLIHEDQIRFMFSNWKEPAHSASKRLATATILSGLESGFDVIYEGISNVKTYDEYFQQIVKEHTQHNYFFYLDVSFDETLKRHDTRPQKKEFGHKEMKLWLDYASPTGYGFETIIPEESTTDQTINCILKVAKYVN